MGAQGMAPTLIPNHSIDRQVSLSDEPMKVQLGSSPDFDIGADHQKTSPVEWLDGNSEKNHQNASPISDASNAWSWNGAATPFCPQNMPPGTWLDDYSQWECPIQPTVTVRFRGLLRSTEL